MAWLKEFIDSDTGVTASFWEVIGIEYQHKQQVSNLRVGLWISQSAYNDGKSPIKVISYSIPAGLAPELASGALAFVSGYAKAQPEFVGWSEV